MANIRINLDSPLVNGQDVAFRSPTNCSEVTGLAIYYYENGVKTSQTFQFADAHGSNVGSVDLFAADVLVKVILDTEKNRAYVQNADTNAYLEERIVTTLTHTKSGTVHKLTGLGNRNGLINVIFKVNADFVKGNTFTVDGIAYTAKTPDGKSLSDGFFVNGAIISCIIDTVGKTVNFKMGGGSPASYRLALSSLTAAVSETQYLEMLDAVRAGRAVIIEAGSEILTYVVHDVDIEDAGYDPGHIPFCLYGSENGVLTYTLYAVLSGMAPMKLGSYRELGTLSKPATAAQIMKGYRAYDDKGRSMTGTLVPNTIQSGSKTITEDDVEEGTYTKFTVTATGSTIDMASAWITNKGDTVPRLRVALIIDGAVVEDGIGDYHTNTVSVSGNKISFSIADDEVLDYSDYIIHWKIVSH